MKKTLRIVVIALILSLALGLSAVGLNRIFYGRSLQATLYEYKLRCQFATDRTAESEIERLAGYGAPMIEIVKPYTDRKMISRKIRHLLAGGPQVIIRGGVIDQRIMAELRFTLDDLMTALRSNGIFDIRDVQLAVVETNGTVSAYQKSAAQPLTPEDLHMHPEAADPLEVIIADGAVSNEGLAACGMELP